MQSKPFLNSCEFQAHKTLAKVAAKYNYEAFPKVRIADVVTIDKSKLDEHHYSYALKAHFDFLFVHKNHACLALEIDGPDHFKSENASVRDLKKNFISEHFGFDLLRIDAGYLNHLEEETVLSVLLDDILKVRNQKNTDNPFGTRAEEYKHGRQKNASRKPKALEEHSQRVLSKIGHYKTRLSTIRTQENNFCYTANVLELRENYFCIGQGCAQRTDVLDTDPQHLADTLSIIELDRKIQVAEIEIESAQCKSAVTSLHSAFREPECYPKVRKQMVNSFRVEGLSDFVSYGW